MNTAPFVLAGLACAVLALPAPSAAQSPSASQSQQNMDKMKQFRVATTDLNIPAVPQEGRNATAIGENLKRVKLPPGSKDWRVRLVPKPPMLPPAEHTKP